MHEIRLLARARERRHGRGRSDVAAFTFRRPGRPVPARPRL